jgi:restriction endonuclease S subunit
MQATLDEIFKESNEKGWGNKSVEEVTELVTKGTTPKTSGRSFTESGVPFLRAEHIINGPIDVKNIMTFISDDTHNFLSRSKTKIGDVLMTIAGTIGRVAWIPEGFPEFNMNQAVAIIRPKHDLIISPYLTYVLSANAAQGQVSSGTVKGAIPNFSLGMIKKIKIPLPPLAEQKKIVARLDGLSEKVQKLQQLQDETERDLKALKRAILERAFAGV